MLQIIADPTPVCYRALCLRIEFVSRELEEEALRWLRERDERE